MNITREDRWKNVIDKLTYGEDTGVERVFHKKNTKYVHINGRKISIKKAAILSGIPYYFFIPYTGKEIPLEDIMDKLDKMWIRDKVKKMRIAELSL